MGSILRPFFALAIVGAGAAFIACGDDTDPEEARVAVCADHETLETAIADFQALDDSNTFAEFDAAADAVRSAADSLEDSALDYLQDNRDLVDTYADAVDEFGRALDDLSSDMTVGDAKAAVQDDFDAAIAARDALIASANCGT